MRGVLLHLQKDSVDEFHSFLLLEYVHIVSPLIFLSLPKHSHHRLEIGFDQLVAKDGVERVDSRKYDVGVVGRERFNVGELGDQSVEQVLYHFELLPFEQSRLAERSAP